MKNRNINTNTITTMAMMCALSIVLVLLIHTPLLGAAPFLEYDPADIPIFIVGFAYGPWAGLLITVVTSILQGLTVSVAGSWYGIVMHIVATGSFVIVSNLLYQRQKTKKMAAASLLLGTICATVVMIGANLLLTPLYMQVSMADVRDLLLPAIIPFNLLKFSINSVVTFLVYKSLRRILVK